MDNDTKRKKHKEKRSFLCSYTGCKAYITSPSPKTKFCKKHRQVVYKKNYLNRNLKLRAKYQASKTCFSGSSDPFDGQDLDDMLHQVLVQKRLALMHSPSLIKFLQLHQSAVKNNCQRKANEELRKFKAESSEKDINANMLFVKQGDETPNSLNEHKSNVFEQSNGKTDLKVSIQSPVNVSSNINSQNSSSLSKVKCIGGKRKNIFSKDSNDLLHTGVLPKIVPNKTTGNLTQLQLERKSAFQETGAGDVNSLLAIRAVNQEQ